MQTGHAGHGVTTGQSDRPVADGRADCETLSIRVGIGLQAATSAPSRIAATLPVANRTMWVIFLEMGVALGLLLLIVWWTWPKKKRPDDKDNP